MADAAQEFLTKQISKNRFTANQQQRLENSGGASVAGYGDGVVPRGDAYAKYGKLPEGDTKTASDYQAIGNGEQPDFGGGFKSPNSPFGDVEVTPLPQVTDDTKDPDTTTKPASGGALDEYRGFGADSDSGRNYSSGAWGKGDLDAAALAEKYGLDTSKEGRGDGHIWGRNADGSEVYIGKSSMDLASNKDLIASHSGQANSEEDDHSSLEENLSSAGDIKGAILSQWKGGDGVAKAEPEKERTPIEHSPEIKQATERVRAYEDNIMSGKTSSDIFGDTYGDTGLDLSTTGTVDNNNSDVMQSINNKYSVDYNQGSSGIGVSSNEQPKSNEAAASFLDSKKSDYKSAYNFKPGSKFTYGSD